LRRERTSRSFDNPAVAGTLFVVGTPIGNVEDMTARARRVLGEVDLIACEDTRRTGLLVSRLGIDRPRMVSFFQGNEARRLGDVVAALDGGRDVALVTDAGMPGVSDPGFTLVRACVEGGIDVVAVPGVSAVTAALAVSGLPSDRFVFEGFFPRTGRARHDRVTAVAEEPRTVVLFESPRRLLATLGELAEAAGPDRRVAVCRELTKLHEEVLRGTLGEVTAMLRARGEVRGEIVVVLEGATTRPGTASRSEAVRIGRELEADGMRKRDAAREAAARTGVSAREIYAALTATPADGPTGGNRARS
jgi:16S rRNA (cytidine1402-2'-O)-methyltransferase